MVIDHYSKKKFYIKLNGKPSSHNVLKTSHLSEKCGFLDLLLHQHLCYNDLNDFLPWIYNYQKKLSRKDNRNYQ